MPTASIYRGNNLPETYQTKLATEFFEFFSLEGNYWKYHGDIEPTEILHEVLRLMSRTINLNE